MSLTDTSKPNVDEKGWLPHSYARNDHVLTPYGKGVVSVGTNGVLNPELCGNIWVTLNATKETVPVDPRMCWMLCRRCTRLAHDGQCQA